METESRIPPGDNQRAVAAGIAMRSATVAIFFVLIAVILFSAAGRLNWIWAWVFLGICVVTVLVNGTIMLRTSPETIAERARFQETKGWDKVVGGLWALTIYIALPLVAGLDVRFGWTGEFGAALNVAGAVVLAVGLALGAWAMIVNAYFSTAVRIQSDRGQTVCRTGPYRFVRHPGYLGFTLQSVSIPVLLGSLWALIPGMAAAALMITRTSLEDRTLQAELPGHRDFVQEVRHRLLPGIW